MTPNKAKKPLPSSTTIIIAEPEEPQTSKEWKTGLQRVKSLYLKNQWKQCAARCSRLLGISDSLSPLYAAFLHFYTALSNEAIARSTHNLSTTKIPLLEEAKRSYQAASRIMPTLEDPLAEEQTQQHQPYTHADKSCPSSASSSGISTPKASPPSSPTYPSSASSTCSLSELQIVPKQQHPTPLTPSPSILSNLSFSTRYSLSSPGSLTPTTKTRLRPSPLRIIPPTTFSIFQNLNQPRTPPAQIIPSDLTSITNRPLSVSFSASSAIWLQNRSLERYHTHLIAFANMLIAHIEVVEGLMQATEEAQATRPGMTRSTSAWFGGGDSKRREVRARVERGRFAPERYQELCARALGEL